MKLHMKETKTSLTDTEWDSLALKTEGYSGSDLASCVHDAMFEPLRELRDSQNLEINNDTHASTHSENIDNSLEWKTSDVHVAMV